MNIQSRKPEINEEARSRLLRLLEDARRQLVETGTRNRLIHVNRENKRGNVLNIINERSDDIFEILKIKNRKMRFKALGDDEDPNEANTPLLLDIVETEPFDEARYTDNLLETPLSGDKLQKRLLKLYRDAKSAEEEQGVNVLYLALGFLTWLEDKSSAVPRHAPLILMPVELVRNDKTATFDILCRDDDMVTNLPLQERLKTDFGIVLPDIPENDEWTPESYFAAVGDVIEGRRGWQLDPDGMQLGFFSFAKLLMLRDLDPENWPGNSLLTHPMVEGLMLPGQLEHEVPLFGKEDKLDKLLEPADIIQVVDADASQTKVIEEVRSGRNLVVQGPPGTGKSQTITNIIAAAVHDGKKVLFIAEKMAALSVVHNRLVKVGLSATCLELHSRTANKKAVLGEISASLQASASIPEMPGAPDELKKSRDALNGISEALHQKIPGTEFSAFDAMSSLVGFLSGKNPPPQVSTDGFADITSEQSGEIVDCIERFSKTIVSYGCRRNHPLFGVSNLSLQPTDVQRIRLTLNRTGDGILSTAEKIGQISKNFGVSTDISMSGAEDILALLECVVAAPDAVQKYAVLLDQVSDHSRLSEGLVVGKTAASAKDEVRGLFLDSAWTTDISSSRVDLQNGVSSFFSRLGSRYRRACKTLAGQLKTPLPKTPAERLSLCDRLLDYQSKQAAFDEDRVFVESALAAEWRGEKTVFEELALVSSWLIEFQALRLKPSIETVQKAVGNRSVVQKMSGYVQKCMPELKKKIVDDLRLLDFDLSEKFQHNDLFSIPLEELGALFRSLSADLEHYGDWVEIEELSERLAGFGLNEIIQRLDKGEIAANAAVTEFKYARAEAQWDRARAVYPHLNKLSRIDRQKLVDEYQFAEAQRIKDTQKIVLAKHLAQMPRGAAGEMSFIRGEIARKRGHKPIRKIIEKAGSMVQRIKPVFLMSPISVAQFLPPGSVHFDLLVIDEASQVRPEDAIGAVARAGQIVVVGDQKQLPPTSFFDRMTSNTNDDGSDEEDDATGGAARATELESVLTLCEARGLPQRMLEWHYRSRDPSLIRVSNVEFYGGNLVLPPSPLQDDDEYGLKFVQVPGAYSSGTKGEGRPGANKIEAFELVKAVSEHARKCPNLSLGIVTFSVKQRDMVTELLEYARREDPVLDTFLREGKSEDVFVKNIENVQGDERDVIFISVGYGPHEPGGHLANMRFGPVNGEGGERRLNVLFSRSRTRCVVFASFNPGDIDLSRTTKDGPRVLKRFLNYASSGQLDEKVSTGFLADSPFEEDVADVIRGFGYEVDHQVGSGGFLIDLGVKHPERKGQYMLAVECDGATYHSALWARERDRLRQAVLENLGWQFHRIWSTDWFHRRSDQIQQLKSVLDNAANQSAIGIVISGANDDSNIPAIVEESSELELPPETFELPTSTVPKYERSSIVLRTSMEPHEVHPSKLSDIVLKIVDVEGPIHSEEIARRLASAFGKERAGQRIKDATNAALKIASETTGNPILSDGNIWMTELQQSETPVRDRSEEAGATLQPAMLPPIEIKAAAQMLVRECGHLEEEELVRSVARLFGFKRVGTELKAAIAAAL